jgi:hypothetical protein
VEEEEMTQLVSFPTHTKGGMLDLLITNCVERIVSICEEGRLGKSEHSIILHYKKKSIILFEVEDIPQSVTEESTGLN